MTFSDRLALCAAGLLLVAGCSKSNPATSPSPEPTPGNTITITAAGANPRNLTIAIGTQVTFVNNDSRPHEMDSDPHPEHTDCPEFDSVGRLVPGATRQTKNFTTARTCGFHDHLNPFVSSLTGSIRIQ